MRKRSRLKAGHQTKRKNKQAIKQIKPPTFEDPPSQSFGAAGEDEDEEEDDKENSMNPAMLQLVLFGIEEVIQQAPALAADLQKIFATGTPTAADFAALRAKVASESYAQFVPGSAISGA